MADYVKLFSSILDSSIMEAPLATRWIWVSMLAMKDRNGVVSASVGGLARRAGVSREQVEDALRCFLSPDDDSRTKDDDGRRIEVVDGGWLVLNHEKYRDLEGIEDRRQKDADRQRRRRDRLSGAAEQADVTDPVTPCHVTSRDQIRSGSDLSPSLGSSHFTSHGSDPDPEGARSNGGAKIWAASDWLARYGRAWVEQYQQLKYGQQGDSKACGALMDTISGLPEAERLTAQEKAPAMFAEFLGRRDPKTVERRHPFAFFVQEWGGLRVPKMAVAADVPTHGQYVHRDGPRQQVTRDVKL